MALSKAPVTSATPVERAGTTRRARVPLRAVETVRRPVRRRARTARETVIAVLLALVLGAVFNVESLEKTAASQPYGWRRSLATHAVAPVAFVADRLHLTAPRDAIQDALGESDVQSDRARLPSPFDAFFARAGEEYAQIPQFAPRSTLVWVGGDSMAYDIARAFQRAEGSSGPAYEENTQISTGLARPDVFDWAGAVDADMHRLNPDVAVFSVGGNDDQDMMVDGKRLVLGTDAWKAEYRRRVGAAMDVLASEGRRVVWVGYPIVREKELRDSLEMIAGLQRAEAGMRPQIVYVPTWDLFADDEGAYADYLPDADGELQRMRRGDGVHLTQIGGDRMLAPILEVIAAARAEAAANPAPDPGQGDPARD
ncbi:MAG: DUF459 domain-containing protein [Acidimicrobiia bacterium]|nr:DUF459 domain-containing protein [Acidimicrobiia bacterium]